MIREKAGKFVAVCAAVVVAAMVSGCHTKSAATGSSSSETSGPTTWELRNVATAAHTDFASFHGKVIFLNVWATWCPPCVAEMPSIHRLYERFKNDPNVEFVLVSIDDSSEDALAFLEKKEYSFPTYSSISKIPPRFKTQGIPATFLVAPDGTTALERVGGQDWDTPDVIGKIKDLAKAAK